MLKQLFNNPPHNVLDQANTTANSQGEITNQQQAGLQKMTGIGAALSLLAMGVVLVIPVGGLFFSVFYYNLLDPASRPWLLVLGVAAGMVVVLGAAATYSIQLTTNLRAALAKRQKLQRDLQANAIRQSIGRLSFGKDGYTLNAAGKEIHLPEISPEHFIPGAEYRVFYLEESGFALSMQLHTPADTTLAQNDLSNILAAANEFTHQEMELNRNGKISPRQRWSLLRAMLPNLFWLLLLAGGIVLGSSQQFLSQNILVFLIVGFFLLMSGIEVAQTLLDLTVSPVTRLEGQGHKKVEGSGNHTHHTYQIGQEHFGVSDKAYDALTDGWNYRVYYLPRTKTLLSIEPITPT